MENTWWKACMGVLTLTMLPLHADLNDDRDPARDILLDYGHIALQAEGQGVWYRNIELKSLED